MAKFRNNLFYLSSIIGLIAWIVNTVGVMRICGISHPIIFWELFFLVLLGGIFYSYTRKTWEDIETSPFRGRAEVTEGDVIVYRFLGPWITLVFQLVITGLLLNSAHKKIFEDESPKRVCEPRRKY